MSPYPPPRHRRGYVLLLTLVSLALVAAGLAGVARRSHAAATEANRLERQAQRYWLAATAEPLLPHADILLNNTQNNALGPPVHERSQGKLVFSVETPYGTADFTLGDEQAKANANALWDRHDRSVVQRKLTTLASTAGSATIRLRPVGTFETIAAGTDLDWPTFATFEQLITPDSLYAHLREPLDACPLLDHVTLWGDGRIRVDRATRPALEAVLNPLLSDSQIDQLIAQHQDNAGGSSGGGGGGGGGSVVERGALQLTDRQLEQLEPLLTDTSTCFSLRLRFDDGRRVRTRLVVLETSGDPPKTKRIRLDW